MARQQILEQVKQDFGLVPGFMAGMPDPVLEQYWSTLNWVLRACLVRVRVEGLCGF